MQKKQNVFSSIKAVFKGIGESFGVILLNKPIKTDFTPKEASESSGKTANKDDSPPSHISNENQIIISEKYQQDILQFIKNHSNLDTITVPCFFNNEPCSAFFCSFPRIIENEGDVPFIRNIVSVVFSSSDRVVGQADYGANAKGALEEFRENILRLTPIAFNDEAQKNITEQLRDEFPFLTHTEYEFDEPDHKTEADIIQ